MVSLKLKLSSSPLYLLSSIYIFIKFVNSLPKPWLNEVGCINEIGYINGIVSKIGFMAGKVKIRVLMVLILAKLFLKR